jgi:hypothetical protein
MDEGDGTNQCGKDAKAAYEGRTDLVLFVSPWVIKDPEMA